MGEGGTGGWVRRLGVRKREREGWGGECVCVRGCGLAAAVVRWLINLSLLLEGAGR